MHRLKPEHPTKQRFATSGASLAAYVKIARPDHWFKNLFMLPGMMLVFFFDPQYIHQVSAYTMVLGVIAACLVASSNYVLNEILDAERDSFHPKKHTRPIPSGQVSLPIAYSWWMVLAVAGLLIAAQVSGRFLASASLLWLMGLLYNVPPVRLKDVPYADVCAESLNNPIRLAMGWYATGYGSFPTLSIVMAYWMLGAFLMAAKRFAEYRAIDDPDRAALYRTSFAHYDEQRLLASILFYASSFALFLGVFIARYRVELVLATPIIALTIAQYLHVAFSWDSPAQHPEKLYRARRLLALVGLTLVVGGVLLFVDVPLVQGMFREWYEWNR